MGRGVADNKGALACRLAALPHLSSVPGVVWLLQGEEETGSQVARHQFPRWLKGIEADVWLDENGYHDQARGSLRLISCRIARTGLPSAPDARLTELLANLEAGALLRGRVVERAVRRLNKALVPGGCAFQDNLPNGARYLALGVNDTASRIHTPEESVPQWAFAEHVQQLKVLWRWLSPPERAT